MFDIRQELNAAFNPITVVASQLVVTSDYHCPYIDEELYAQLLTVPEETGIKSLVITGDLFDMDAYSRFTPMGPVTPFEKEINSVKGIMGELLDVFETLYVCRGNHEKRIIDENKGRFQMRELMHMVIPDYMSKSEYDHRVIVTNEDHVHALVEGHKWMFSHPRNFRIINLSVARDLAARFQCSQIVAHGHQMASGWDRSGTFRLIDGGGLFDKDKMAYLRETTCYPETKNGFVIIQGTDVQVVEGK